MLPVLFAGALLALGALILLPQTKRRRRAHGTQIGDLERRYARLLQMPPKAAEETLTRVLGEMAREHPNRSRQWLLKKMISDLERDRR